MFRNIKENFGVIIYKNMHLAAYGRFATVVVVLSVVLALISLLTPNSVSFAAPLSIFGGIILIVQYGISFKEQITSSFDKCAVSPQAKKNYNNLSEDNTPGFSIISLPSKSKISFSNSLNKELLSNKIIPFTMQKNFENVLLNNWNESKKDLANFLVYKSQEDGHLFNENKVALLSSLSCTKSSVDIGKTSYFTSLITNEAAGKSLLSESSGIKLDFNNMLPINNGKLLDIASSKLSNHIGVTLLGLTKDNHLVFWTQNSNAQVSVNSLVATGSGSLDWLDITNSQSDDLLGIVKYGMARELVEESSLDRNLISDLSADGIILTGFFRWIERGGKPEFVGICNIPVPTSMFRPNIKEVNNKLNRKITEHPLINSMNELSVLCKSYLKNDKLKIGVSSEFLLHQLNEISSDEESESYKIIKKFWNFEK